MYQELHGYVTSLNRDSHTHSFADWCFFWENDLDAIAMWPQKLSHSREINCCEQFGGLHESVACQQDNNASLPWASTQARLYCSLVCMKSCAPDYFGSSESTHTWLSKTFSFTESTSRALRPVCHQDTWNMNCKWRHMCWLIHVLYMWSFAKCGGKKGWIFSRSPFVQSEEHVWMAGDV